MTAKTIDTLTYLGIILVVSFLVSMFGFSIYRYSQVRKTKEAAKQEIKNFKHETAQIRCLAGAEFTQKEPQYRLIETYEDSGNYDCYVMSKGYWLRLTEYDIDKILNQR